MIAIITINNVRITPTPGNLCGILRRATDCAAAPNLGANDRAPEINSAEIIVDFPWPFFRLIFSGIFQRN